MKHVIYSICAGTLALAVTAWGEQVKVDANAKTKAKTSHGALTQNVAARSYGHPGGRNVGQVNTTRHSFSAGARVNQPTYATRNATVKQHATTNLSSNAGVSVRERNFRTSNDLRTRRYVTTNRNRTLNARAGSNVAVNRSSNVAVTNNWRGSQFSSQSYAPFRNYSRTYHDRSWWQSHYPRISFYFGAPYYWDSGYWYPAWGYYPDYVYDYDGPIYGYNGLAPDRVVVDVQIQLRRDGYYTGRVDGVLGSRTRRAIAAFQADHGLAVTAAIDQPTLETLGV